MSNYYLLLIEIIVFIVIMFLVFTDRRFSINRKILFLVFSLLMWVISFFIDKVPLLIIKDLFWYTLVLNISFIIHVLILNRIFEYSWKNYYEYAGFLISRISFTMSIWGVLYFIKRLGDKYQYFFRNSLIKPESDSILSPYERCPETKWIIKYRNFYYNYIKSNKIFYFIFYYFHKIFIFIKWFIFCILIHFSLLFHNYSLFLLGKKPSITLNQLSYSVLIFIIFFILSWIIGMPRLYIIWIFQIIIEMYKILTFVYIPTLRDDYLEKKFIDKIKMICNYDIIYLFENYYENKYHELKIIYEESYHLFFLFDLYKFLLDERKEGIYSEVYYCEDTYYWESMFHKISEKIEYPILKVYKYYPWEELALGYCKVWYIIHTSEDYQNDKLIKYDDGKFINIIIEWLKLINAENPAKLFSKILLTMDKEWLEDASDWTEEDWAKYIKARIFWKW